MDDNLKVPAGDENLKMENDFLKMKLMLEQGAQFGSIEEGNEDFTAEMENKFLRNIAEFEKQFNEQKMIRVFEKIEKPSQFRPVIEIPAEEIELAWNALQEYLSRYNIELNVCSPNVSNKELYRFTVEELFEYEMSDMVIPGMVCCFTYDEFHPDHEYENTRVAVDECIQQILIKEPFDEMCHFRKNNLRLNTHYPLTGHEFKNLVNRFHDAYDNIEKKEVKDFFCSFKDNISRIKGSYVIVGKSGSQNILLEGNWLVEFEWDENQGYWYIVNVQIEGINF